MKTKLFTLALLFICSINYSQVQKIKIQNLSFKTKNNFTVLNENEKRISFIDTINIDNEKIIKKITVSPNVINPKTNNIKNISDIIDLEMISFAGDDFNKEKEIQGITELDGKQIVYREIIKETYNDYKYTNLTGYEFSNTFYYFSSPDEIVSINYVVNIANKDGNTLELNKISRIIAKNVNLDDVNYIILSMK